MRDGEGRGREERKAGGRESGVRGERRVRRERERERREHEPSRTEIAGFRTFSSHLVRSAANRTGQPRGTSFATKKDRENELAFDQTHHSHPTKTFLPSPSPSVPSPLP